MGVWRRKNAAGKPAARRLVRPTPGQRKGTDRHALPDQRKQIDVGDALSTHVKTELAKPSTVFAASDRCDGHLSRNAHEFICDAVVHLSTGLNVQAKGASTEIYAAFDQCKERMDKQLRRYKRRLKDHHKDREPVAFEQAGMYVLAADEEAGMTQENGRSP